MPKLVDDSRRATHVTADTAESLGQRAHLGSDRVAHAEMIDNSPPVAADDPFAVGVVDHQHGCRRAHNRRDAVERRQIAVHRENPVGDDQSLGGTRARREQIAQRLRVGVRVAHDLGAG